MSTLPASKVLRALRVVLLAQASLSAVVAGGLHLWLARGGQAWPALDTPHALVSVALGLLLVHRMTAAQSRFWEGRRAWQRLLDTCRNAARRAVTWTAAAAQATQAEAEAASDTGRDIAAMLLAMVAASEARLSGAKKLTFGVSLSAIIPKAVLQQLEAAPHGPLACATEAGRLVARAQSAQQLSAMHAQFLEEDISEMLTAAGDADCIARTPTPVEYSQHTSRFLTLFCFSLPLVLTPTMGWLAVPTSLVVSYSLLAIDEISAVVESPFAGYLPLRELYAALRLDLTEFLGPLEARSSRVT